MAGDVNTEASGALKAVVGSGRWADLHEVSAAKHGHEIEFMRRRLAGARTTRIDRIYGSKVAWTALGERCTVDLLLPVHRAVRAGFSWRVLLEVDGPPSDRRSVFLISRRSSVYAKTALCHRRRLGLNVSRCPGVTP